MTSGCSLTVVIPVHNEAGTIADVVRGFYGVVENLERASIIVAEDGSDDGTKEVLMRLSREIPFRLVSGKSRKGYLRAVKDALSLAESDLVFFADSDGTHDPRDLLNLLGRADRMDLVCGIRATRKDPPHRILLSKAYNLLMRLLFSVNIRDTNCGFKLMRKDIVKTIVPEIKYLKNGFSSELVVRAHTRGKRIVAVPIRHFPRRYATADQFTIMRIPNVLFQQFTGLVKLKRELSRQTN